MKNSLFNLDVIKGIYKLLEQGVKLNLLNNKIEILLKKSISEKDRPQIFEFIKRNEKFLKEILALNKNAINLDNPILHIKQKNQILSYAQERLWFIEKYEGGSNAYNIPMVFKVCRDTKLDILEKSIIEVINRHEVLRTLIKQDNEGNGYQVVLNLEKYPLEIKKIAVKNKKELHENLERDVNHIYKLEEEYPIRVRVYELLKSKRKDTYISIVIHHIAFDGWSTEIFLKEVEEYYRYYSDIYEGLSTELALPNLDIQYKDFALWQRNYLSGAKLDEQLNYWKNKLSGYESLNLITDKTRPSETDYRGEDISFEIEEEVSKNLRELAKELKVSLYSLLLAGYYLMLSSYSNQDDIVIGVPIANRHYSQIEGLIGFFVNSLALRTKINPHSTIKEFIKKVGEEVLEAQLHQDLPFEKLVDELNVAKDTSRHPIFQVTFGIDGFGQKGENKKSKEILEEYEEENLYKIAKFDLSVLIDDSEDNLRGSFNYAISLYKQETIRGFIGTYKEILKQFSELTNNKKISELRYLSDKQYEKIIHKWNETEKEYPFNKTIQELFEEQAKKTPDKIAVVYGKNSITYAELNRKASHLACYLQKLGVGPEILVGIGAEKSLEIIIGILGVLKAGGAYVPLDLNHPTERLKYILEDSKVNVLLTQTYIKHRFATYKGTIIELDSWKYENKNKELYNNLKHNYLNSIAYVIYTSGSTGKPKGVAVKQGNLVSSTKVRCDYYQGITSFLLISPIAFDSSIAAIFSSLVVGGELVLFPSNELDIEILLSLIKKRKISHTLCTPSVYELLLKYNKNDEISQSIKNVIVAGESCPNSLLKDHFNKACDVQLYNEYGPTECTVWATVYKITNKSESVKIGRPIDSANIYILNDSLNQVPIGALGELYIGGEGLARGYINKAGLTAEKFIANPFATEDDVKNNKNLKLYKTGDLGRYLPDGNIEFLGRLDDQVKLRGYRIELGEIESILITHKIVSQVVVLDSGNGEDKKLIAYITLQTKEKSILKTKTLDNNLKILEGEKVQEYIEKLRSYLIKFVPKYMIPAFFVFVEKMPLNINGKIDKNILSTIEINNFTKKYIDPRNKFEKELYLIWKEVLKIKKISIDDNFFKIGGHSLLATQITSRIRNKYDVEIPLKLLFVAPTIRELSLEIKNLINKKNNSKIPPLVRINNKKNIPLSFAQQRLWFLDQLLPDIALYNIPEAFILKGKLNVEALDGAFRTLIKRHEILRTAFKDIEGEAFQEILPDIKGIKFLDISSHKKKKEILNKHIQKESNKKFNLREGSLISIKLLKIEAEKYALLITMHHIIADAWSIKVFLKELSTLYNNYIIENYNCLLPLNLQYSDYSIWQRKFLQGDILNKQLEYWKNHLQNIPDLIDLPTDKIRPKELTHKGDYFEFNLPKGTKRGLEKISHKYNVTLFMLLLSMFKVLLYKYSRQKDIVVGTTIANRHHKETEDLLGFFANTLALRTVLKDKEKFVEFLKRVREVALKAYNYQDLPFEQLVDHLNIERSLNYNPVFQVMFDLVNMNEEDLILSDLKVEQIKPQYNVSKFDLSLSVCVHNDDIRLIFEYSTDLFERDTIKNMAFHYYNIITEIINDAAKQIGEINIFTEEERKKILIKWNDTKKSYPIDKCIHELFEEQVQKTPEAIAVAHNDTKLTYIELNERANFLAKSLIVCKKNSEENNIIGIFCKRGIHFLIAILGILKSGKAYLPLDPTLPEDYTKSIIEESQISVILTRKEYFPKISEIIKDLKKNINVQIIGEERLKLLDCNLKIIANPTNIAYVIFTSGTTGRPKGIMVEHRTKINHLFALIYELSLTKKDIIAQTAPQCFDISVWQFLAPLLVGACTHIFDIELMQDPMALLKSVIKESITILQIVPSVLSAILEIPYVCELKYLKYIIATGEAISPDLCKKCLSHFSNIPLINAYGPAECSDDVSLYFIRKNSDVENGIATPIGKPISNMTIYILDSSLNPVSIGVAGELYIGGIGLARGYLSKPGLTSEKFIANPFATEEDIKKGYSRLYKTGDLAKWLPDGNIEYIGRNDFQVKIRGHRIELAEIENTLLRYDGIKQVAVIVKEGESEISKYLVGYYVTEAKLEENDILSYLRNRLPEHMIPSVLMQLDKLPLTANGKLDRKALPDPDLIDKDNYIAPKNEVEQKLCNIWSEVLGIEKNKVGIQDDFFRLGGNSILVIRLVSKINKELKTNVDISSIFKFKTISNLVQNLIHNKGDEVTIAKSKIKKMEDQLLSYAQERLWFIEKYEGGSNAYNIPMVFKVCRDTKLDILEKSIIEVVNRHEILRTLIKQDNEGNGYQVVLDLEKYPLEIKRIKIENKKELQENLEKDVNHIYKLEEEYPIRVRVYELIKNKRKETYISIVIHHIAFDGWSTEIFLKELEEYYRYYSDISNGLSTELVLPNLDIQYKDFALWQRSYLSGAKLDEQLNYWKNKLSGYESLNLITDKTRPSEIDYRGEDISFEIDEEVSNKIRELAKELKVSLYSLLLAGYYLMLSSYSNQDDIVIGVPIANRHYSQIEGLIGFFVNSLALRTKINPHSTIKEFIEKVGEEVLEAQLHQDLPFEKLVDELNVTKDTSRHPIFQVMFGIDGFGQKRDDKKSKKIFEEYEEENLYKIAKFDLSVLIDDSANKLKGSFNYALSLYEQEIIKGFIDTYKEILKQFSKLANNKSAQKQKKIVEIKYLSEKQYQKIIYKWNKTEKDYPVDKTIQALFEEQVEKTPDSIAVVCRKIHLTYKELNELANQLAHYLIEKYKIKADDLIALCLDRSEHMQIAILSVLKAGGAYVPLDPNYPDERLSYALEDTKVKVLLADKKYKTKLQTIKKIDVISTDDKLQKWHSKSFNNPRTPTKSNNLAYVIYTSGSTGKPKGVGIEHKSVVSVVYSIKNTYFQDNPFVKIYSMTNYVFDIFCLEYCLPLVFGGLINIGNISYTDNLNCGSYNFLQMTPSVCELKLPTIKNASKVRLFIGGESLTPLLLNKILKQFTECVNVYGPAEATIWSSSKYYSSCCENRIDHVSIGCSLNNYKAYILNSKIIPVPIGGIGDLYVGGQGLARGYLSKPGLTSEKFIANPYATKEDIEKGYNRLYKTGDLVRWLPDGNIEYIGRNDFQVKIRGHRIELGEIENAILSYDGIKQVAVIVKEGESEVVKYLVGYYVTEKKLEKQNILSYVRNRLPEHMVPSVLMQLDKLPLTANGKLDRNALPNPDLVDKDSYVAPKNEIEDELCNIWSEILGIAKNKVGVQDDFFRLGGNSILVIKLVSKINKFLKTNINIASIFKLKTISNLAQSLIQHKEDSAIITKSEVKKTEDQALSYAQERLWFIEKYEGGSNAYNIPMVFKVCRGTRLDILEKSIIKVVNRHEVLRTLIKQDNEGNGYQVVLDLKKYPLEIKRIGIENKKELQENLEKDVNHIYKLEEEYPIRVRVYELLKSKRKETYISIVIHHIAFDGWSTEIFLKELEEYYRYYSDISNGLSTELALPNLDIQYKDFALWQRNYLSGAKLDEQLNYWKNKLSGYESLNLITDKTRPSETDYRGEDISFEIDEEVSNKLRELAKELKVSLYSLLLAGYYLMLSSYSNQDDIVIGVPIANRHYSQIEGLIGFFVNSLALRTKINPHSTIKEFIEKVGEEVLEAQLHQDLPFEKLVDELNVTKDTSRHPIFQVMFELAGNIRTENSHLYKSKKRILEAYEISSTYYKVAKFDLSTIVEDTEAKLKGSFNYAVSLYKQETIKGFIDTYKEILKQLSELANNREKLKNNRIKTLSYLAKREYEKTIKEWNSTDKNYPKNKTIQELFEKQVKMNPDRIAVEHNGNQLTYAELNRRANQLGYYLRKKYAISADKLVVLCLDRSYEMLIGIFGVLKAGGAYVPLDPTYPDKRLSYVLEDTNAQAVITNKNYKQKLDQLYDAKKIFTINNNFQINKEKEDNLESHSTSDNIAIVIYTSGTTGNPKGVMIEHGNKINHLFSLIDILCLSEKDNVAQTASQGFDISIWQMLAPLLVSGRTCIFDKDLILNASEFLKKVTQKLITILQLVPMYLDVLIKENQKDNLYNNLKYIIVTGEHASVDICKRCLLAFKVPLINFYGPAECSDDVTIYHMNALADISSNVSIGKPISNTKTYVLFNNLSPVPIGGIGELYVGGEGVSRGYLNKPRLTAEKFLSNPFQNTNDKRAGKNARMYKTGDLVRWLPDGNLEYIGRNDFQVKIRGHRIELGEIENVLLQYDGIKQSVVLSQNIEHREGAEIQCLVGYYVIDEERAEECINIGLSEENILEYLRSKLPEYMLPTALIKINKIPLTTNGKLDRKALPIPKLETNEENYESPKNTIEKKLCEIWGSVLNINIKKVGIKDDFFKLGGDSIISIQLVSKIKKELGFQVTIKDIFNYRNVKQICAALLKRDKENIKIKTEQGILKEIVELLPIQKWFFDMKYKNPNYYNQSFMIKVPVLSVEKLQKSINTLIHQHDALRLRYKKEKSISNTIKYIQHYNCDEKIKKITTFNIQDMEEEEGSAKFNSKLKQILTEWQSNFDIESDPMYTIGYLYGYKDGSARIFFALHHLIVDAVSWRILAEDLRSIYEDRNLGFKGSSYRQWVDAVKLYGNNNLHERQYWKDLLKNYSNNSLQNLQNEAKEKSCNFIEINKKQTALLLKEINKIYNTEINDILLTALGYALANITEKNINHIVLEGHGREEIDNSIDITKCVGWFTTMYPVKLEITDDIGISIKCVKENLRQVPNKGIGYGVLEGYNEDKLPKIIFNYLGQFDKENVCEKKSVANWNIVDESSGEAVSKKNEEIFLIDINGLVIDNKLKFEIESKLCKDTAKKFSQIFKSKLEAIIKYLVKQKRGYLTLSDIDMLVDESYLNYLQRKKEILGIYTANNIQKEFLYCLLNKTKADNTHTVQFIWEYNSKIDIKKLKKAWIYAQKKYEALRLRFSWHKELIQIIDKESKVDWRYIDLSNEKEIKQIKTIKSIPERDRKEAYGLNESGLFRVYIIKQKENLYTCIFSNHHAILDGWSVPVLLQYVHETYIKLLNGKRISISVDTSYGEAQKYLQLNKDADREYWNNYIKQIKERIAVNKYLANNTQVRAEKHQSLIKDSKSQSLIIKDSVYNVLKKIACLEGVSINAILQYIWHTALSKYENSDQTVVGTVVSGRNLPIDGIEKSVGAYINIVPLIVNHDNCSIRELIKEIQNNINEINTKNFVSLTKLNIQKRKLFNSLFVYENYPNPTNKEMQDDLGIRFIKNIEPLDNLLKVTAYEEEQKIIFKINHVAKLVKEEILVILINLMKKILHSTITNLNGSV